jgi:hypothetical protein
MKWQRENISKFLVEAIMYGIGSPKPSYTAAESSSLSVIVLIASLLSYHEGDSFVSKILARKRCKDIVHSKSASRIFQDEISSSHIQRIFLSQIQTPRHQWSSIAS